MYGTICVEEEEEESEAEEGAVCATSLNVLLHLLLGRPLVIWRFDFGMLP